MEYPSLQPGLEHNCKSTRDYEDLLVEGPKPEDFDYCKSGRMWLRDGHSVGRFEFVAVSDV